MKRGRRVVAEGRVASLRRVKDKVEEVGQGVECGLGLDDFMDWHAIFPVNSPIPCLVLVLYLT